MADTSNYQLAQIERIISETSELFDVVRLVDPISMTVYSIRDGELVAEPGGCYHVWKKGDRCENCISSRCFMDGARYSKFEFIDQQIFHVVAQPVTVEGQRYVLEVVTASNDNVLLTAFGNNAFVERITTFNHKIYTDELTGLSNRRFLDERFGLMIDRAQHDGSSLAVAMLDIDDFKDVNDKQGHLAGDRVLTLTAHALREGLVPTDDDILARYGGDEFFAAFIDLSADELKVRIERAQAALARENLGITLSIGAFCQEPISITDSKELIQRADRAMYQVKAVGKNGFRIE